MLTDDFFLGTKLYHKKIIRFIEPISKYLGVNQISYITIDKHGLGFSITSNCKMVEDSIERSSYKYATFFVNPTNMHTGFALDSACNDENYKNNLYIFATQFDWHNSFIYAEKDDLGGYYALNFATDKNNFMIFNKLINERNTVKNLIRKINNKIMSTFNKDIQEKKVDFAALKGESFYTTKGRVFNEQLVCEQQNKIKLLKEFGVFNEDSNDILSRIKLSQEELNCLKIYYTTHSVKRVAKDLNLTIPLVDSYIENIKNKFDCYNKTELFEKAEILESLGHIHL